MTKRIPILFVSALACWLAPVAAQAHWCDDIWTSSYNIVVRPESDTITAGGSTTIYVQNNMGYLLPNFVLNAQAGSTTLTAGRVTQKVTGTLLPGEKAKYTLAAPAGSDVKIETVSFSVKFGSGNQYKCYPLKDGSAVVIQKKDGNLVPSPPVPGITNPASPGGGCIGDMPQGRVLQYSAMADFNNLDQGLDKLMNLYCAGRKSWASQDGIVKGTCDVTPIKCGTKSLGASADKYNYVRLWAAGELAVRKSALGDTRLGNLRAALQCGTDDTIMAFSGLALMALGYLGEDSGARTFIQGKIDAGGDLGTIAKAALLLMGNADDKSKYLSDVQAGAKSSTTYVASACAATLGIVNRDDDTVSSVLFNKAKWTEPDTSDNGQGLYSSQLLAMVAWDRRGWAAEAGDKGAVSFYEGGSSAAGSGGGAGAGGGATAGSSGKGGAGGSGGRGGNIGPVTPDGGVAGAGGRTTPGAPDGGLAGAGGAAGRGSGTSGKAGTSGSTTTAGGPAGNPGGLAGETGAIEPVAGASGSTDIPGGGGTTGKSTAKTGSSGGCSFGHGSDAWASLAVLGLGLALVRRRRR